MSIDADGELSQVGDRWQLRFHRLLPHPPEKVWRALTEPDDLAAWFPAQIEGERGAGATWRFVFPDQQAGGEGRVLTWQPPTVLEYRWEDATLRFDLRAEGPGCRLTFTTVFGQVGQAARDAAGWHTCLDVLDVHLRGERPPWEERDRWAAVHADYVERLGPRAATIGPPEGHEWTDRP